MYAKDFDKNGSVDPIMCTYVQGVAYPYLTRDELLEQLGSLRTRFTNYKSYASVTMKDLFKEEDLTSALRLSVNQLETSLFLSDDDGFLSKEPLPVQSQYSCVNAISVDDYDNDGKQDLLFCGNTAGAKLKIGKLDANYGIFLKGNGSGKYSYVDQVSSGLKLRGNISSIVRVGNTLLFPSSTGKIEAYSFKGSPDKVRKTQIAFVK
jgi:enediyne biosynthesis protein E4